MQELGAATITTIMWERIATHLAWLRQRGEIPEQLSEAALALQTHAEGREAPQDDYRRDFASI